jgi:uncharacterized protein (TIGR02996 family)
MTEDELSCLRAIVAKPDEDLPRLIFADYLEEHGQLARSEFIRMGCESARCQRCDGNGQAHGSDRPFEGPPGGCPPCNALRRREQELLTPDNARQWVVTPPDYKTLVYVRHQNVGVECYYDHPGVPNWRSVQRFHRGFVDEVYLKWNDWIEVDRVMLASTPIWYVMLTTWPVSASGIGHWRTGGTVKLPGDRFTKTYILPDDWTVGSVTLELLKREWPTIRKWNLADEETSTMTFPPRPHGGNRPITTGATGTLIVGGPGYPIRWTPVTGATAGRAPPPRNSTGP